MMTDLLSICIIGKDTKHLEKCINHASKVSRKILYVDLNANKQNEEKASDLGARIVNKDSLSEALQTEWVVFLKPNEKLVLEPGKALESILRDTSQQGYFVYTKSDAVKNLIDDYQLIRNLQQYKDIDDLIHVTILEPRLARKSFADYCLKCLMTDSTVKEQDIDWQTAGGLSIDPITTDLVNHAENAQYTENTKEHDKRCLKGDIYYGITWDENLYELSSHYMGFRVLHERYLNGFVESANRGFGTDNMYLPMLEHLNKFGYFEESKRLYESWIDNRYGEESADIYMTGGTIYAHLFLLDEAIANLKRATKIHTHPSIYAEIGKLYLIKGERENAVTFLEKSIKMKLDPFHSHILSIIKTEQWQPTRLSLCMIARDEEHTIGKAIESMKNIADEIIVVDTDSKDSTKNIAAKLGSKVIETQWNDDFSAARNIALKEAHGDYVFILDSDEFIDSRDQLLLALLKNILPASMDVAFNIRIEHDKSSLGLADSLLNELMKQEPVDYQVRLFPRRDDIFFANAAFESVKHSLIQANVKTGGASFVKITHRKDNKSFRNERKLHAVKNSFSSLDDSSIALKGGLFFLKRGDLDQGYQWFKKVKDEDPVLLSRIAALYTSQNLHDQAEEIINRALTHHQDFSDLHLALAKIYFQKERYTEVCDLLGKLVNSGIEGMDPELVDNAFFYYGIALLETGQIAGGIDLVARILEKDPLDMRYQIGGLYAFAKSEQWEAFLDVSGNIIQKENIKIDFEIRDFSDIGHLILELFRHYTDSDRQDEALMCQKILTHLIYTKIVKKGEIDNIMTQMEKIPQTI